MFTAKKRRKRRQLGKSRNSWMSIEPLEYRKLLTTLVVDSVGDENNGDYGTGDFTLREAISVANQTAGPDTIVFDMDGAFALPTQINLSGGELVISESIAVEGPGADHLSIDANQTSRIFNITAADGEFTFRGLALTGGESTRSGGAIRIAHGALQIEESNISGNSAMSRWGGGIYSEESAHVTVIRSTISNNAAAWGGGLLGYGGVTVEQSTISGNSATWGGGAIWAKDIAVSKSTIADNTAGIGGGGIDVNRGGPRPGGSLTIDNSIVANNHADNDFSPDLVMEPGATVTANFTLFGDVFGIPIGGVGNILGDSMGDGVVDPRLTALGDFGGSTMTHALQADSPAWNAGDPAIQEDELIFDQRGPMFFRVQSGRIDLGAHEDLPEELMVDSATDLYDGNVVHQQLSIREAVELANFDPGPNTILFDTGISQIDLLGGQLEFGEAVTVAGPGADRLTIDAGGASRIFDLGAVGGQFTVRGITLSGGRTDTGSSGGAIRISAGDLHIEQSAITGNTAQRWGGGIYSTEVASVTVNDSSINDNVAIWGGGLLGYGNMTIANSTISGNSVAAAGGGLWGVHVSVHSSTIANNSAVSGAGIDINRAGPATAGSLTIQNSILADNASDYLTYPDLYLRSDTTLDADYTLFGDVDGITISGNGNLVGDSDAGNVIDPQLGPLALNGGPTPVHALLPASIAIDSGNSFAIAGEDGIPDFDQRGEGFTRVHGNGMDMGAIEAQPFGSNGDFNEDGVYDCVDIDMLVAEIAAGTNTVLFDMTGDNAVDLADRNAWLAQAGSNNLTSTNPYLVGDANLDGTVDGLDFIIWNDSKFTSTAAWCQGDFNADGTVDGLDYIEWNTNKFTSANAVTDGDPGELADEVEAGEPVQQSSASVPGYEPTNLGLYDRDRFGSPREIARTEDVRESDETRLIDKILSGWN